MPHLVFEYSDNIARNVPVDRFMLTGHEAALASGLFAEKDIKTRAYPCNQSLVAGVPNSFMHVTVKLLSGRDSATKKLLTQAILDALISAGIEAASLSVEACDIDRDSYSKITR